LGNEEFHRSHRANLLRKDLPYYSKFGWIEDPNDPYMWMDRQGLWYKHIVETGTKIYLTEQENVLSY
jgi:hypothetical protein